MKDFKNKPIFDNLEGVESMFWSRITMKAKDYDKLRDKEIENEAKKAARQGEK